MSKEKYLGNIASGELDYLEWNPERFRSGFTVIRPLSGIGRT